MKPLLSLLVGFAVGALTLAAPRILARVRAMTAPSHDAGPPRDTRAHTSVQFEFTARGSLTRVAPLFGAQRERVWAAGWNPAVVYPSPGADEEGMVFTVGHASHRAVWANTRFDLVGGHVQYACVIPDVMVTLIRLDLTPAGDWTRVTVTYDRTALNAGSDEHVDRMAALDRTAGPEWEDAINDYLAAN